MPFNLNLNIQNILPIIVPDSYYKKGIWDLPHQPIEGTTFLLTWVILGSEGSMSYLTRDQYNALDINNTGWQKMTFENLRLSINENENFFTQYKRSNDGRLLFVSFMNADGIGSSRILLAVELTQAFPDGYYIAIPDRSCGLVVTKNIRPDEIADIRKMLKNMYKNATTAMSDKLFLSETFKLPVDWITPFNPELSALFVKEIIKLKNI